jgi:hypothetical protein
MTAGTVNTATLELTQTRPRRKATASIKDEPIYCTVENVAMIKVSVKSNGTLTFQLCDTRFDAYTKERGNNMKKAFRSILAYFLATTLLTASASAATAPAPNPTQIHFGM